jgi:hypothetical protein
MKRFALCSFAVLAFATWMASTGCPPPPPPPRPPEVTDAGAEVAVAGADATPPPIDVARRDALPPTALDPEGPRLRDTRFDRLPGSSAPPEGTPPVLLPTPLPDGDRAEPPDIGPAAIEALKSRFGCQVLGQVSWPAAWLSPLGVVLECCNPADPRAPAPADGFRSGCLMPFDCSWLIDEGMGAISKLETVTALRQRLAPLRDARTALAVVDATVRDVVPLFGDRPEETSFVLEGSWKFVAPDITGTRVLERPGGGYDVTTFVVPGCGCHHDLTQVQFIVDELAGVTEQSRTVVAEDLSSLCVD